jgi:hypothetical protein
MKNKIDNYTLYSLILFSVYCAAIIGISWDDFSHIDTGNQRLKYLFSFGSYNYNYSDYGDQKFYPGFYNTLSIFVTKIFPKKYEIEALHLVNSSFSILTIFGIYKISSELFNKKIGKIVFLLCFFNPIFFGYMAINHKDTIIAFANIWATCLIIRYLKNQQIDKKRNRYIILAGLVIGFGLGVRIVFLSTLIPIIVVAVIDGLFLKQISNNKFSNKKFILDIVKVLTIAYIIMISCWPDTHKNIFILPFKLFLESFNKIIGISSGLFNGNFYNTSATPKSYILINLFYKLPEFILFGCLVFIYLILIKKNFFNSQFKSFNLKIILILFIILFPNLLLLISPYKIYDGLRLFLYIIPYVCIIPGLAIYYLIFNYKLRIPKILITIIFSLFAYYILIFFLLTPYQYTYLNVLNGNFSKSYKKFENDYWAVSLKELVNQIPSNKNLLNNKELKLAFCGAPDDNVKSYLRKIKNFQFQQVNWVNEDFDYIIMTNRVITEKSSNMYNLTNVKTCFDVFSGIDVLAVSRNGLILSTLRKKI